tara:strand:+ start:79 stop:312 length:234 start_codon:yes stop_codon:yes gene_type:complete
MNWQDILKSERAAYNWTSHAKNNLDKFNEEEKKLVMSYIESLENKYDKNTLFLLATEMHKKDLLADDWKSSPILNYE